VLLKAEKAECSGACKYNARATEGKNKVGGGQGEELSRSLGDATRRVA